MIRNLAAIVMGVAGAKEKVEKVWPMFGDKRRGGDTFAPMSKEFYEKIKKIHNLK